MKSFLLIEDKEALIQIDGRVYKIPGNVNLVNSYRNNERVMQRTRELAGQYGTNFWGFDDGIRCIECSHTKLFDMAIKDGSAFLPVGKLPPCSYEGNTDYVLLFKGNRRGLLRRQTRFMARDFPCTIKDAFHRALQKEGFLDQFLLRDMSPGKFHFIREFEGNGELEIQASRNYAAGRV